MKKRLIAVICVALLVLSCASARILNFAFGPSISYSVGNAPTNEDASTTAPYSGATFGFDGTISLTFGDRAEVYFQDQFNLSGSSVFKDTETPGYKLAFSLDYISRLGYEHAILTGPLKVSVGGGFALEMLTSVYENEADENKLMFPLIMNLGVGLTTKVEYALGKHFAVYAKAYADYYFATGLTVGVSPQPEGWEPKAYAGTMNNFNFSASAGLVLFF